MKCNTKSFIQLLTLSTPLLALGCLSLSPLAQALTPDKARETFIWQGFQGGPAHKGHIPISILVDNSPGKVNGWPMRAYLTHPVGIGSGFATFHLNGNPTGASYIQIHQMLNQPTVVDDALVVTNRGYVTPFAVTHIDRITNHLTSFDYLDQETDYIQDANGDYLDDKFCPQSQSQAVYQDDIAYIATNYYELSAEDRLCDNTIDTPNNQLTHLRAHPIRPDKDSAGGEDLEIVVGDNTKFAVSAHHKDQFLSPTIESGVLFSQGGGLQSTRDHTGVFSIENVGTSAQVSLSNLWEGVNSDGYIKVAPNSLWAPAVNSSKVITFLNGSTSDDYRNNIPTLTEIDRATGAVTVRQLDSIDFAPTQEADFNVYNMATAPVLVDNNTLITVNNGNLIFFDVSNNQFRAAATPIDGEFYGQPVVANDTIFVLSRDQAECPGYESCIRAISATSKSPVKDSAGDNWVWLPPSTTETINFPFVATNSHIFVSSDMDNTYGINTSTSILNSARLEMTYPLGGELAFAYDTLFIAHSAPDATAVTYADLKIARPTINQADVSALNNQLTTTWNNHDVNITGFTDAVKTNSASVVVALTFPVDESRTADLDIDLSITNSGAPTTIEIDQIITYQATVTNRGALNATNVTATAKIPGAVQLLDTFTGPVSCSTQGSTLTCLIDGDVASANSNTLAFNDTATFTFQVIPKVVSQINMTVNVDGTELNPDTIASSDDDNSATVGILSTPASPSSHDLEVSVNAVTSPNIDIDRTVNYEFSVTNLSGDTALDVRVAFELLNPLAEQIVNFGNCSSDNCTIDRLNAGETRTFGIQTRGIGAGQGGLSVSAASSRSEATDTDLANNTASFNSTNISSNQSTEDPNQLPRAGGSFDWLLSIMVTVLGFACYRRSRKPA